MLGIVHGLVSLAYPLAAVNGIIFEEGNSQAGRKIDRVFPQIFYVFDIPKDIFR